MLLINPLSENSTFETFNARKACKADIDFIYIYIYIYIIHFELRFFDFHVKSWPEWDSNPRPCAYRAHALTTELSGRTTTKNKNCAVNELAK